MSGIIRQNGRGIIAASPAIFSPPNKMSLRRRKPALLMEFITQIVRATGPVPAFNQSDHHLYAAAAATVPIGKRLRNALFDNKTFGGGADFVRCVLIASGNRGCTAASSRSASLSTINGSEPPSSSAAMYPFQRRPACAPIAAPARTLPSPPRFATANHLTHALIHMFTHP